MAPLLLPEDGIAKQSFASKEERRWLVGGITGQVKSWLEFYH